MTNRFIVMTSSAKASGKTRYGRYRNVAVVETDGGQPRQISERDPHIVRVVHHFGACNEGKTEKCEYRRALAEAEAMAAKLNAGRLS